MATATTTPVFRATRGSWISSPAWDAFWMFSALWGSAILLVLSTYLGFVTAGRMVFAVSFVFAVFHS
jgi:hypothetical protein